MSTSDDPDVSRAIKNIILDIKTLARTIYSKEWGRAVLFGALSATLSHVPFVIFLNPITYLFFDIPLGDSMSNKQSTDCCIATSAYCSARLFS